MFSAQLQEREKRRSLFMSWVFYLFIWLATEEQWQGCVWRICFTWVIRQRCELISGEYHKRNIPNQWRIQHFLLFWADLGVTDYKLLVITHCIKSLLLVYRFLRHLTRCMSWYSWSTVSLFDQITKWKIKCFFNYQFFCSINFSILSRTQNLNSLCHVHSMLIKPCTQTISRLKPVQVLSFFLRHAVESQVSENTLSLRSGY